MFYLFNICVLINRQEDVADARSVHRFGQEVWDSFFRERSSVQVSAVFNQRLGDHYVKCRCEVNQEHVDVGILLLLGSSKWA